MSEVSQARELLKSKGYYTENLWQIDDVKSVFQCTNEQAYEIMDEVLYSVFENEWLVEQIFVMIDEQCEAKGIKKI